MERKGDSTFDAGAAAMVGLRLADPFLQYNLLRHGSAAIFMQKVLRIPTTYAIVPAVWAVSPFSRYSIGGLNESASIVLSLYGIAALRHAYWATFTRQYNLKALQGAGIGLYNALLNVINTCVLVYTASSAPLTSQRAGWKQYLGAALFLLGIGLEVIPEETRKRFKSKPENKGKVDNTGAWGFVRHPNFLGYSLWRAGIALATGSVVSASIQGAFQFAFFIGGSIPQLDEQMSGKYREKWAAYKKEVPYAILPYIY